MKKGAYLSSALSSQSESISLVLGVDLPVGKSSSRRLVQVTAKDTLIHSS